MKSMFAVTTHSFALAATLGLAVVVGCGSSSGSGGGTSGCDAYFQASVLSNCDDAVLPPESEITRIQGLFEAACADEEALPGSGLTDAVLSACAAAITAAGCGANVAELTACRAMGSLAAGAVCSGPEQCQSGSCDISFTGGATPACGKCAKAIAVGQPCGATGSACAEGAVCDESGVCATITFGAAGASCQKANEECSSGTYCVSSSTSATCTACLTSTTFPHQRQLHFPIDLLA